MVEFHKHNKTDITDLGLSLAIPPWVPGRWYESQYHGSTYGTFTLAVGVAHYDLIYIPNTVTVTALAARTNSAVTSNVMHLALYNSSAGAAAPTTKVGGGSIAAATVSVFQVTGLNMTLTPGFYWTGLLNTGGATAPAYATAGSGHALAVRGDITPLAQATIGPLSPSYNQTGQTSLPATAGGSQATDTQQPRPRVALLAS